MHTYMDYDGLKFITEKILKKYIHPMIYHMYMYTGILVMKLRSIARI